MTADLSKYDETVSTARRWATQSDRDIFTTASKVEHALVAYADALAEAKRRLAAVEAHAERLAAGLALVIYDAHPTYGSTALWHGGIGGAAITSHCSIVHGPPPGDDWTQYDLPSKPLREFVAAFPFDLDATKMALKKELSEAARGESA